MNSALRLPALAKCGCTAAWLVGPSGSDTAQEDADRGKASFSGSQWPVDWGEWANFQEHVGLTHHGTNAACHQSLVHGKPCLETHAMLPLCDVECTSAPAVTEIQPPIS